MRFKLSLFLLLAVLLTGLQMGTWHFNWRGWLVISIITAASAGLVALLALATPATTGVRMLTYGCAVLATQGLGFTNAILALSGPGPSSSPPPPTPKEAALAVAAAVFSLWTFLLVRSWVSRGIRHHLPTMTVPPSRVARYALASTAAIGVCAAGTLADSFRDVFLTVSGAALNQHMHPDAGGTADWLAVTAGTATAGLREEPIYIGIAALMFPAAYRSRKRFALIAAITSLARTMLHIYYAAGQSHTALALASLLLWCTIWSTANLAIFYRAKSLVPLIIGHGVGNIVTTNTTGDWKLTGVLPTIVEIAELVVMGGIAVGAIIFTIRTAVTGSREIRAQWRQRKGDPAPACP